MCVHFALEHRIRDRCRESTPRDRARLFYFTHLSVYIKLYTIYIYIKDRGEEREVGGHREREKEPFTMYQLSRHGKIMYSRKGSALNFFFFNKKKTISTPQREDRWETNYIFYEKVGHFHPFLLFLKNIFLLIISLNSKNNTFAFYPLSNYFPIFKTNVDAKKSKQIHLKITICF